MNVVMDDATEVYIKDDKASVPLGMSVFLLLDWPLTVCRPNSPQRREHYVDTTLAALVKMLLLSGFEVPKSLRRQVIYITIAW
jgi:hypothetical protein